MELQEQTHTDPAEQLIVRLLSIAEKIPDTAGNWYALPCDMARSDIRAAILKLEADMRNAQNSGAIEKTDINDILPLQHFFAPGAYGRQILLKKFNWAIGKIHRHAHLNFVMQGKVIVLTEDGPVVIKAPHTFVSSVGTKRFVLALEDTIWATVHVTDEIDLEKIEEYVIAPEYEDLGIIENAVKEKLL